MFDEAEEGACDSIDCPVSRAAVELGERSRVKLTGAESAGSVRAGGDRARPGCTGPLAGSEEGAGSVDVSGGKGRLLIQFAVAIWAT